MRTLKTGEAAALLNVTPNTLRTWERRFGYPKPQRRDGKHRHYAYAEIAALREALQEGLTISSAVSVVSEAYGAEAHAVLAALGSFRAQQADVAMEGSLALRTLERSVEQVLLPALNEVRRRKGSTSAAWAFAATWGNDWLRRAQRMAPDATHYAHLLIGDATDGELEPAAAYTRALGLCCARKGITVYMLPVSASYRLAEATAVFRPNVVVIAGCTSGDQDVARWAYAVRSSSGKLPFLLYHRGLDPVVADARARILPRRPTDAQHAIALVLGQGSAEERSVSAEGTKTAPVPDHGTSTVSRVAEVIGEGGVTAQVLAPPRGVYDADCADEEAADSPERPCNASSNALPDGEPQPVHASHPGFAL